MTDEQMDQVLAELSNDQAPPAQAAAARDAVWQRLAEGGVCSEIRRDFSSYASGALPEARRLLVDDHPGRRPRCGQGLVGRDKPVSPGVVEMKRRTLPKSVGRWIP